jgi:starvation-inducible DNA-binding protein
MNHIGLDSKGAEKISQKLNTLLANYQLFYINTRGFHWNITGEKFFELHLKFEEIYNDAQLKIDEIAERILTLGYTPLHNFEDYLAHATITPQKDIVDGKQALQLVVDAYAIIIPLERELLGIAEQYNDEGTNALMSDYIREQEKKI